MTFDLYADLVSLQACPTSGPLPSGLASGFVDGCTAFASRGDDGKNDARVGYMKRASAAELQLPSDLLLAEPGVPSHRGWLAIEITFKLCTPWYSKDDRPFHVLYNPVRKDRVFGVPFMAAASWKGLLRWACRMQAGLCQHLEAHENKLRDWSDPPWIVHLFGNEKTEENDFQRGALAFYPTWFSKLGFEVINPHSRKRRAGRQPIYYEVVPARTSGVLRLLYAPLPGAGEDDNVRPAEALEKLTEAIDALLTQYGTSAKRTAGWGLAKITGVYGWRGGAKKEGQRIQELKDWLAELLPTEVNQR